MVGHNPSRAYSRKTGYVYGVNKKGHILVSFGQFEVGGPLHPPPKHYTNLKFLDCENAQKNQKGHCVVNYIFVPLSKLKMVDWEKFRKFPKYFLFVLMLLFLTWKYSEFLTVLITWRFVSLFLLALIKQMIPL